MVTAIVLAFLIGICLIHFVLYKIFDNGTSQFLMLGAVVFYGITSILQMVKSLGNNDFIPQLLSFITTTAIYFFISLYSEALIKQKLYKIISRYFQLIMSLVCIFSIILFFLHNNINTFYFGLAIMSIGYIIFSATFLARNSKKVSQSTRWLLYATYFMIFSFTVLSMFRILQIQQVYYCTIGVLVFLVVAETIGIKEIKNDLKNFKQNQSLSDKEQDINNLIIQGLEAKDIAMKMDLSLETIRKYMKNIYKKYGVHSKDELVKKLQNQQ